MIPNRKYIIELVEKYNWTGGELARRMDLSRSEANRFLNNQRIGGKKLMSGIVKAFPGEPIECLFILPKNNPNVK